MARGEGIRVSRAEAYRLISEGFSLLAEAEAEPGAEEWLDQHASPIGPRRHVALCRRLLGQGSPLALRAGRRWLLKPEALSEASSPKPKKVSSSPADRLASRLKGAA
jgi:hypothetical protein